ncbi:hypothetical protein BO79DRAFT_237538 [Aspergillus costaricaensis CBS 115574]|uniref:Uncharacterized protein n=1 Tax=Aspergillus costaricaensis CBS 115574 TaxID=1448317 RepID=A0ACD1IER9_9EURO|nr:hypothetical protein BO79DRAFT_237538 [Aspergillus costaricaensis CBS 115574]RAK88799.1 hypothetical protein BO79DRAFT_237538 [Aspergillus costaricaensis CBS 115574]
MPRKLECGEVYGMADMPTVRQTADGIRVGALSPLISGMAIRVGGRGIMPTAKKDAPIHPPFVEQLSQQELGLQAERGIFIPLESGQMYEKKRIRILPFASRSVLRVA